MAWGHPLQSHTPIFREPSQLKDSFLSFVYLFKSTVVKIIQEGKKVLTSFGSSGIKGLTMSLQSGAVAAPKELRASRNTTAGRAIGLWGKDEIGEGQTAALPRLRQKTFNTDSFSFWGSRPQKKLACKC